MKKSFLVVLFVLFGIMIYGQDNNTPSGIKFGGALPAVAYDSDLGFRYGVLGYIYDWGDGTYYPNYKKSLYLEWSRTTKGSGNNTIQYDDRAFLGSKIRFTSALGYYIEQSLDFYGYNGYQSIFNPNFSTNNNSDYRSRMFYRMDRRNLRGIFDFQIPIIENKLRVYAGITLLNTKISSVDVDKLNKGKDAADLLPSSDTVPGLYELYSNWGLIDPAEKNGGFVSLIKGGLIYDTRNNEAMPTKGIWDELILLGSPGIGGTSPYLQLNAAHSQYFTLVKKHLSFAYRLSLESKIAGNIPFYMLPYVYTSKEIRDGLGGSKTVRGMLRNRLVANTSAYANLELRWRVVDFNIGNAHFYAALSAFTDAASVLVPYDVDFTKVPSADLSTYIDQNASDLHKLHLTYGGGIRLAFNENTIVAIDYGKVNNSQDGSSGLYIGLGWLF